jgi:hypothetical protein
MSDNGGIVTAGIVAGGIVVGGIVVGGIVGTGPEETGPPSAVFTIPSSDGFPVNSFHRRRALVAGTLARAAIRVNQGGVCLAASISQGTSRANPVTYDSGFAGCTHTFASLPIGDSTCSAVTTALQTALVTSGATDVSADGCELTVANVESAAVGRSRSTNRSDQGVWGMQRDYGFTGDGFTTNAAMGATYGVHMPSPCTGRVLSLCIRGSGGQSVRLGLGRGPAYSVDPAAVTIDGQCLTAAIDANAIGCCNVLNPITIGAADSLWMFIRAQATETLRYRAHTPGDGHGDLVTGEQLIGSALTGAPGTAFGATVDVGGGGGPFARYAAVSVVYECADAAGTYPGDGAIDEWIGYQPTTLASADLRSPADTFDAANTFRYPPIPWSGISAISVRQAVGARTAGDDFGLGIYSWSASDATNFPSLSAATLLQSVGAFGVSSANAYNVHILSTPIGVGRELLGGNAIGVAWNSGRAGGTQATTLQFGYDENGTATACDLVHWGDDGRAWSDFCDEQGYGVNTEYQARASNGTTMPTGDPALTWPNPFAIDSAPPADGTSLDVPRQAIRVVRPGITVVVH